MTLEVEPPLEDVKRLVANTSRLSLQKSVLLPVFCEIPADLLTPVSVYLCIAGKTNHSFLFESVSGGGNISRYSFVGAEPFKMLRIGDNQALKGDPLLYVDQELNQFEYVSNESLPGFTGGAVGYISYDCAYLFEPSLKRELEDELNIPDSMFMLYNHMVIFDHVKHTLTVVCHLNIPITKVEDSLFIEQEYHNAIENIEKYRKQLTLKECLLPPQAPIVLGHTPTYKVGESEYSEYVRNLKEHIVEGDIFQAVPSRRISRQTSLHPFNAYRELRSINPSPYMFYLDMGSFQIVGASPEMFAKAEKGKIFTHPIAGTRKRGSTVEADKQLERDLLADQKETSEHVMLVDLGRNDINRVCKPATVKVDSLMHIERYSHVMHIVSNVSGELREDKSRFDAFRSIFPAGTLSGAPKVKAMELISKLEKQKRGIYGGAIGYFDFAGGMDTCIAIRTMLFKDGVAYLQAGGGIVHHSNPEDEYKETVSKLASNLTAIDRAEQFYFSSQQQHDVETAPTRNVVDISDDASFATQDQSICITSDLSTNNVNESEKSYNVTLLIDNYDSFTWNIYQYVSLLNANVKVFRNDKITLEECIQLNPINIIISPGPGRPSDSGISMDIIRHFAGKVPILGVCLGEQCFFEAFGGKVVHAPEIVHGRVATIMHDGEGLYEGIPQNVKCTRYHSLVGDRDSLPTDLKVTSWTEDDMVMGVRHKQFTVEGVQFHPESILSEHGLDMFKNFLKLRGGKWDDVSFSTVSPIKEAPAFSYLGKSILTTIQNKRIEEVKRRKLLPGRSEENLKKMISLGLTKPVQSIYKRIKAKKDIVAVMAEVKRASPSKGDIYLDACAAEVALLYAEAGASVISVLTEPNYFKGSLRDLSDVRNAINLFGSARPSVLCKDFIVDTYQIYEARLAGADSILLIVAILDGETLQKMIQICREVGMEPLVEVSNEKELAIAVEAGARVIGVNNRNLHTFEVNMNTTTIVAQHLKKLVDEQLFSQRDKGQHRHHHHHHSIILCALSGIKSSEDVKRYSDEGVQAVLVGEAIMRASNKAAFMTSLLSRQEGYLSPSVAVSLKQKIEGPKTLVKICGIRTVEEALFAARKGADFIGLVFSESRRKVDMKVAKDIVKALREFSLSFFMASSNANRPTSPNYRYQPATPQSATGGKQMNTEDSSLQSWYQDQSIRVGYDLATKRRPFVVGVFANQEPKEVTKVARQLDLDFVQLHGDESISDIRFIMERVNVIKVIKVDAEKSWSAPEEVSKMITKAATFEYPPEEEDKLKSSTFHFLPQTSTFHLLLLDTSPHRGELQQGGHGKSFNWAVTKGLQEIKFPFILAGGLTPKHVREAMDQTHPMMVDVSSGVEKDDKSGKDFDKMSRFIEEVKGSL